MTAERTIDPGLGEPAYLGKKETVFGGLDVFPNPGTALVRMTSDEVTSLCPITNQPDFEVVDITYAPRDQCIESKSLKLFLASLRNTAGFVESLACDIAALCAAAIDPQWVRVDVTQKARGGISIVATAVLHRDPNAESGFVKGSPMLDVAPPFNHYLGH